jgi:HAD superfamily hydrolase (TIGR01509 family)
VLVIFDCDGVLVDTEPRSNLALQQALAGIGLDLSIEEVHEDFLGISWRSCLQVAAGKLGHEPPASFTEDFHTRRDALFRDGTLQAIPGVAAAVDAIVTAGHDICVASSGEPEKMTFTLNETGLWDRFAGRIFSAVEVEHGKPAPDLFLHAAARMGREPADCLVVEDAPAGVAGAKAAGMRVLAYAAFTPVERLHEADATFDDMAALPGLL